MKYKKNQMKISEFKKQQLKLKNNNNNNNSLDGLSKRVEMTEEWT